MKVPNLGGNCTMIESAITGILLFLAMVFFFGYAIYSSTHHPVLMPAYPSFTAQYCFPTYPRSGA